MKTFVVHLRVIVFAVLLFRLLDIEPAAADTCPTPSFIEAGTYGAGRFPNCVAVGDFNGDGKADLVVANLGNFNAEGPGFISVLLGNGDGTFQPATNYNAGITPGYVITGDFNRDGKIDLAVCFGGFVVPALNQTNAGIAVLLGNGDGSFQSAIKYTGATNRYLPQAPRSVAVGDINGDGKPDLVVADYGCSLCFRGGTVWTLLGNGDGTFQQGGDFPSRGVDPWYLALIDFNGDGILDYAVAVGNDVEVFMGKGDGNFKYFTRYDRTSNGHLFEPSFVVASDFNNDGKVDLATASYNNFPTTILLGNGDGTLNTATNLSLAKFGRGPSAVAIATGDFNGDHQLDLAAVDDTGVLGAVLGKGDGSPLNWLPALEALETNGDRLEITAPLDSPQRFFRLHKP